MLRIRAVDHRVAVGVARALHEYRSARLARQQAGRSQRQWQ
jgi:hypothetical protein